MKPLPKPTAVLLALAVALAPLAAAMQPCCCWGTEVAAVQETTASKTAVAACCSAPADSAVPSHRTTCALGSALPVGVHAGSDCCCVTADTTPTATVQVANVTAVAKSQPLILLPAADLVFAQCALSYNWQPVAVSPLYPDHPSVSVLYGVWLN